MKKRRLKKIKEDLDPLTKAEKREKKKQHRKAKLKKQRAYKGSLAYAIRTCDKYKEWHSKVKQRDKGICQVCGLAKTGRKRYHVHHIVPFAKILKTNKITSLELALSCSILWDVDNAILVCKKCHQRLHKRKLRY